MVVAVDGIVTDNIFEIGMVLDDGDESLSWGVLFIAVPSSKFGANRDLTPSLKFFFLIYQNSAKMSHSHWFLWQINLMKTYKMFKFIILQILK